jgi:hypothetical protein
LQNLRARKLFLRATVPRIPKKKPSKLQMGGC